VLKSEIGLRGRRLVWSSPAGDTIMITSLEFPGKKSGIEATKRGTIFE